MVVYGHTPVPEPEWINNTICLDTGCVFGGRLTALRYPERELLARPAHQVWYEPTRPLVVEPGPGAGAHREPDTLTIEDVLGNGGVETRLMGRVAVREENGLAALEVMSRFAVDPRWLVYLPPTMAPSGTSSKDGHLEHPAEAFKAYRELGVGRVVCEEKHMGSRAVAVVCRSPQVAASRFGVDDGTSGAIYTRTGRSFFRDPALSGQVLARVRDAAARAGLWDELGTGWLVLDGELMPWSAKATELIRTQYAATGAAARVALPAAAAALAQAAGRGLDVTGLAAVTARRALNAERFRDAYARYCWPVEGLTGLRFAPFQVLAAEGGTYATARDHLWHLEVADRLAAADSGLLVGTGSRVVDLAAPDSEAEATEWWEKLTAAGGEGMVVKPLDPSGDGPKVQPGLKVRGREYLRIIYGPDYSEPENLARLRDRSLGRKRSLAMREHALGLEALDRLTAGDPLWRIHQPVFAVLALESEPVDPRL
jgi:polynucleotide kinase-phosphatase